jgi:hypothetical protein
MPGRTWPANGSARSSTILGSACRILTRCSAACSAAVSGSSVAHAAARLAFEMVALKPAPRRFTPRVFFAGDRDPGYGGCGGLRVVLLDGRAIPGIHRRRLCTGRFHDRCSQPAFRGRSASPRARVLGDVRLGHANTDAMTCGRSAGPQLPNSTWQNVGPLAAGELIKRHPAPRSRTLGLRYR